MERDQLSRKLAVILHADVVGSTALVQQNETLAHKRIQAVFNRFSGTIEAYGGVTCELRGDALLAEFDRASDAVAAALAFQDLNHEFNSKLGDSIQPHLRMGISLGEVVIADNTITGAGVVLAQRLEQTAEPEGVVVQASISETVPIRMPFDFTSLGELRLKGFDQPVRACTVKLRKGETLPSPEAGASVHSTEAEDHRLADKPSIAVLPFHNMSDDPEQEYFANGLSEDIITVLSRVPDLVVIAWKSSFAYKGDIRKVGRELGVKYVLEGSIQKSGDRIRITAQLVDSANCEHIWAEHYDRHIDDVFAIQDQITREIVVALSVKLTYGEELRAWSEYMSKFEIWQLFQRGTVEQLKFTQEGSDKALQIARSLREMEPDLPLSRVFLGWVLQSGARYGFIRDAQAASDEAESLVLEVLAEDENNGDAHALLGYILTNQLKHTDGIKHGERSIELGPSLGTNHAMLALSLFYAGEHEASLKRMKKAIRLTSYPPNWFLAFCGDAHRSCGDLETARAIFELLAARMPGSLMSLTRLAVIYSDLEETGLLRQTVDDLISINPYFTVDAYLKGMPFKIDADRENLRDALLKAGLPC